MNEFSLSTPDLQETLLKSLDRNNLSPAIREEQIILCLGRAYRSLDHTEIPSIDQSQSIYIPFYVVTTEKLMHTVLAAGLPNRLMSDYQFKVDLSGSTTGMLQNYEAVAADVPLAYILEVAGSEFIENPTQTRLSMVNVPFYKVMTSRGTEQIEILINAYNGDVLLEYPPPQFSSKKATSTTSTAIIVFAGLVMLISGSYLLTGSLLVTGAFIPIAFGVTRMLVLKSGSDFDDH